MECSVCHTQLANDLDTFGDVHEPLCEDCFFTRDPKSEAELEALTEELDDLESDLEEAQSRIDELEGDIRRVRNNIKDLKAGKRGNEQKDRAMLEKWIEKVAA
jgi:predicted  nucleic acid-binding Zn-ribbon protein